MSRHPNQKSGYGRPLTSSPPKTRVEHLLARSRGELPKKPPKRPDWATVELEDENQPEGAVLVKDSQDNVVGVMSRETFENLRGGR